MALEWDIWILLLLLLGLPYVGGPILVRFTQRVAAHPELEPLDPEEEDDIPRAALRYFDEIEDDLAPDGFELKGYFLLQDYVPSVQSILAYFEIKKTGATALAAAVYLERQGVPTALKVTYLDFGTTFQDGVNVTTNNSPHSGVFAKTPGKTVLAFSPNVHPSELFQIHQAMVIQFGSHAPRKTRGKQRIEEFLAEGLIREIERQVAVGYYYPDESADVYRPTWKGAILMTWKSLWPIKQLRGGLARRRAERFRREVMQDAVS